MAKHEKYLYVNQLSQEKSLINVILLRSIVKTKDGEISLIQQERNAMRCLH